MTPVEFLLARIAEDEQAARKAGPEFAWYSFYRQVRGRELLCGVAPEDRAFDMDVDIFVAATRHHARHIVRHNPARVLADCKAKRELIEAYQMSDGMAIASAFPGQADMHASYVRGLAEAVAFLALPYADHPDFDPEWL